MGKEGEIDGTRWKTEGKALEKRKRMESNGKRGGK